MAADTPDPTVKFTIGDEEYEYPDFATLTIDEWSLIWGIAEVTLQDFAVQDDKKAERARLKKLNNPAVFKAFAAVGYLRAKQDADIDEVQELVGGMQMLPFLVSMSDDEEDEPETPTSATKPETSPSKSSDVSSGSSSSASSKNSETPAADLATTGHGR